VTTLGTSMLAAFLVGLGGGAHCALMCGGISSAMVAGAQRERTALYAGFSQLGRVLSYMTAGIIVAALSAGALSLLAAPTTRTLVHVLLGVAWIMIALQLFGWLAKTRALARIGASFWKLLQPLTRRVWPINSAPRALAAGALWGWLPCGMSYAMLMVAAATANPLHAALVMLAFGIGTMPGTVLPALATARVQKIGISPRFRRIAAAAMLAFGVFTVASPWLMKGGHQHHATAAPMDTGANAHQHHH
jgi:sulfite exporter TauE/SafE